MWKRVLLGIALIGACTTENQYVVNQSSGGGGAGGQATAGQGGLGGAGGSVGGAAGNAGHGASTGGQGGLGGTGGEAGQGGAPCVGQSCADIHGACGLTDDGCGVLINCTAVCNDGHVNGYMWCDADSGLCVCNPAPLNDHELLCAEDQGAQLWCAGHDECVPYWCGEPAAAPDAPLNCTAADYIANNLVWCCYEDA